MELKDNCIRKAIRALKLKKQQKQSSNGGWWKSDYWGC